jgi:UDP-N-acetylmuramate-alanine ligase
MEINCKKSAYYHEMVDVLSSDENVRREQNENFIAENDHNDFKLLEESVKSVINDLTANNSENYSKKLSRIRNIYENRLTHMQNDLQEKENIIYDMEDHLYKALSDMLEFCVKYEKVVFQ